MPLVLPTNRLIGDAALKIVTAIVAQNTNANTAKLDLGSPTAYAANEKLDLQLSVPATPSLANGQTLIFTVQDSADGITFAAIPTLAVLTLTGAGGVGAAAAAVVYRLPGSTREFINVNVAASATAGNNTAVSSTWQLLF